VTGEIAGVLEALPPLWVQAWLAAFGLMLGSFTNVLIHRLPRGEDVVFARSACPRCRATIRWHDNVPVLSWLLLRGRCRGCGAAISPRYVVVELLAAALVVLAHARFGVGAALPIAVAFLVLVLALVFTDLEHFVLPDALTLPGTFLGLLVSFWSPLTTPEDALAGCLLGLFVIEALNLAYKLVRRKDGMGAGDTKMMMMVGAFLGWRLALSTLLLACFAGALIGVPWLVLSRLRANRAARRARAAQPDATAPAAGSRPEVEPGTPPEVEAPVEARAERSVLLDLVPADPEGLIAPLVYLVLLLSTAGLTIEPRRALGGLLVGLAVKKGLDVTLARLGRRRVMASGGSVTELAPLFGAACGLPPTPLSAGAGTAACAAWLVLSRPARPALARLAPPPPPGEAVGPLAAGEGAPPPAEAEGPEAAGPEAPLMQAALPFGVFLGVGAAVSLLWGPDIVDWYLGLFLTPFPGE
jgi:leader peptidase (prepilin peptidase)/N-methyltransferase